MRAKRAWIREQLQALRDFPDAAADADYAEPWSDALGESCHVFVSLLAFLLRV